MNKNCRKIINYITILLFAAAFFRLGVLPVQAVGSGQTGSLNVSGGIYGEDYYYEPGMLYVTSGSDVRLTISGTSADQVIVEGDANITLSGAAIKTAGANQCAMKVTNNGTLKLTLKGTNVLTSGENCAGLQVETGSKLEIEAGSTGKLNVTGGRHAAGIGGGDQKDGSNIKINGGTVTADAGPGEYSGAGIGGGRGGDGSDIQINGGTVTANGRKEYYCGAGIGGGYEGNGSYIEINGGAVTASGGGSGGDSSAGIGSGVRGDADHISINKGTVKVFSDHVGIGSYGGKCGSINISGGNLIINSWVGIGGALVSSIREINISGGDIDIKAGRTGIGGAAGIDNYTLGKLSITGGNTKIDSLQDGITADNIGIIEISGSGTILNVNAVNVAVGTYSGTINEIKMDGGTVSLAGKYPDNYIILGTNSGEVKAMTFNGGNLTTNTAGKGIGALTGTAASIHNSLGEPVYRIQLTNINDLQNVFVDGKDWNVGKELPGGLLSIYAAGEDHAILADTAWGSRTFQVKWIESSTRHQVYETSKTAVFHCNNKKADIVCYAPAGGGTIKRPQNPVRSHYTFAGWYTDSALTKPWSESELNLTENKEFYAKWTPVPYQITYKLNGGKNSPKNPARYHIESSIKFASPTRTGYTFGGWYTNSNFKTKITSVSKGTVGNKVLYAKWSPKKYVVKFSSNKGNKVSKSSKSVSYGSKYGTLPTAKKYGYTFAGWYTAARGGRKITSGTKMSAAGSHTLYAHWSKVTVGSTAITRLKNSRGRKASVSYKKVSGAKGYQVLYAQNSKMSRGKKSIYTKSTKLTSKNLKKGRVYYYRVRAYKYDSMGRKVYGKYSKIKKVRIRY